MMILALDLGTRLGWAIFDETFPVEQVKAHVQYGTVDLAARRKATVGGRLHLFTQFVRSVLSTHRIGLVAFEEVRHHIGTDAAHMYGAFEATLLMICETAIPPVDYVGIPVTTVRKFVTGRGNSKKEAVQKAIKKYHLNPRTPDEADALAVGLTYLFGTVIERKEGDYGARE